MDKKKLLLGISLVLGCLAGLIAYSVYTTDAEKRANEVETLKQQLLSQQRPPQQSVSVYVAVKDIKVGDLINSENVGMRDIPQDYLIAGALLSSNSNILGLSALSHIAAGEQILQTKIGHPERPKMLSSITPSGKRAVPVVIDNGGSLAGLLQSGDYVDLIALINPPPDSPLYSLAGASSSSGGKNKSSEAKMVTIPLFQNVLVLNFTSPSGKEKGSSQKGSDTVTLSLSPQEAAMVAFVQEQGKIRLMMRSNSDFGDSALQVVNWDSLSDYLYPGSKERGIRRHTTVEIYRGLAMETVSLPLEGQNK